MCKLFIAAGRFKRNAVRNMLLVANEVFASTQQDGFGFAAYGENGEIALGHYLNPNSYPGFGRETPPFVDCERAESGRLPAVTKALVVHGRTSTNTVQLENCHPFTSGHLILAHNGVLTWEGRGKKPKARHGCDSDQFLTWLRSRHSGDWVDAWSGTKKCWSGYGVFGVIDTNNHTLTVAKCGTGRLSWCAGPKSHFFSTDGSDTSRIARAAVAGVGRASPVRANTLSVFSLGSVNPSLVAVSKWEGFGSSFDRGELFQRSYGGYSSQSGTPWTGATSCATPASPAGTTATGSNGVKWVRTKAGTWVRADDLKEEGEPDDHSKRGSWRQQYYDRVDRKLSARETAEVIAELCAERDAEREAEEAEEAVRELEQGQPATAEGGLCAGTTSPKALFPDWEPASRPDITQGNGQ